MGELWGAMPRIFPFRVFGKTPVLSATSKKIIVRFTYSTWMINRVSVVITAHDRREFLLEAVRSVLNQDTERENFEIIVVKNFYDNEIDEFLKINGVKSFYTEKISFGAKLAIGIENSSKEIISFLDDDDAFTRDRLSRVRQIFEDSSVEYHHSSVITIDSRGNQYGIGLSKNIGESVELDWDGLAANCNKIMKYKGDWYVSAISLRKSCIYNHVDLIRDIDTSLDRAFFLIAAACKGKIFLDSRKTTLYRVHPSTTTMVMDATTFLQKRRNFYVRSKETLTKLEENLGKEIPHKLMVIILLHSSLLAYFFSDESLHKLTTVQLMRALFTGLSERIGTITFWASVGILRKIMPSVMRMTYYRRTMQQFSSYGVE